MQVEIDTPRPTRSPLPIFFFYFWGGRVNIRYKKIGEGYIIAAMKINVEYEKNESNKKYAISGYVNLYTVWVLKFNSGVLLPVTKNW